MPVITQAALLVTLHNHTPNAQTNRPPQRARRGDTKAHSFVPVSYTHLTLPTIYSV